MNASILIIFSIVECFFFYCLFSNKQWNSIDSFVNFLIVEFFFCFFFSIWNFTSLRFAIEFHTLIQLTVIIFVVFFYDKKNKEVLWNLINFISTLNDECSGDDVFFFFVGLLFLDSIKINRPFEIKASFFCFSYVLETKKLDKTKVIPGKTRSMFKSNFDTCFIFFCHRLQLIWLTTVSRKSIYRWACLCVFKCFSPDSECFIICQYLLIKKNTTWLIFFSSVNFY